ncbi:MAG: ROK family transcriptional regulator [Anaerolineaceae bacterium]|nr:ROK family transcriptional regulator [Anaerolineaceae bacterium]
MSGKQMYQAGDQTLLRQINLSAILNHIRVETPVSRVVLAERTGLNKATISNLINELIDKKFVKEIGVKSSGLGRPPSQLILNPEAGFILSSEIGADFISVIGTDFSPKILFEVTEKINHNSDASSVINLLISHLKKAQEICSQNTNNNFLGLALGVPGLVDYETGCLLFAPNLQWKDIPLKKLLESEFSAPVFVDNEANLATLGEYYFGNAFNYEDVLFLSVGVGLGGGMLRQGHLLRGVGGMAGEFGHMTADPDGGLCGCGNRGCWETQASQRVLFKYVHEAIINGEDSILRESCCNDLSSLNTDLIVEAAKKNDKVALDALKKVGHHLGIGIASLINALNPGIIVLGGILSSAWEILEPEINHELSTRALYWNRESTKVVLGKNGKQSCVMGGIAVVYQAILSKPHNNEYIENEFQRR